MPRYKIKLSDGRTVHLEAATPPSEAEILAALAPAAESAAPEAPETPPAADEAAPGDAQIPAEAETEEGSMLPPPGILAGVAGSVGNTASELLKPAVQLAGKAVKAARYVPSHISGAMGAHAGAVAGTATGAGPFAGASVGGRTGRVLGRKFVAPMAEAGQFIAELGGSKIPLAAAQAMGPGRQLALGVGRKGLGLAAKGLSGLGPAMAAIDGLRALSAEGEFFATHDPLPHDQRLSQADQLKKRRAEIQQELLARQAEGQ